MSWKNKMDVEALRQDFPVLSRLVHGKPLVYLDSAATSQKPKAVIEALTHYYQHYNANIHRGLHTLSEEATASYEQARQKVARLIGAKSPQSIVFVRNTTEAINLVAHSWGRKNVGPGDELVLTEMEHHSNLVPWQLLAQEKGARLRFIGLNPDGTLNLDNIGEIVTERTKLVAVTQVSNVLGTINPVRELAQIAHRHGALLLVDGAQSVPHLPVRVAEMDCDFLAFSGHKMLGPTGIGALYAKIELLEQMDPFLGGGDMIREVWLERANWNELPYKFEAGTPNIADAIAFGVAIDYLENIGLEAVRKHEKELTAYALRALGQEEGVVIYGPLDTRIRGGVVSFNYGDIHPHDLGTVLDYEGVAIRAGHHCCQPLMRRLGVSGTARASFYIYNTLQEIDILVAALKRAQEIFGGVFVGRSGRAL